jgi:aryl-alcohol dehydrogenase-like predicted oxidoreductase
MQPAFNLFEREIEAELLAYCAETQLTTLTYGALCRGLLSGRMQADSKFEGDDLHPTDPKFQQPRYAQYLAAVKRLDWLVRDRLHSCVIHLAVRWILARGASVALWGARRPGRLQPVSEVMGWSLDAATKNAIDRITRELVGDPIGAEFMAPAAGSELRVAQATA